ncbi:MAG TPA: nucleotidyltransferase domain-containing protein [Sedimentisphaerales bacterium]|nr:nucleotidyltransferase domain-containing protein [Sedimentisphaerales bacterium]
MKEFSKELIKEITNRLKDALHPLKIYLFGSHACGDADKDSDIDLLVVVPDTDKSTREIARQGRASLRTLCFPVDLIVCTQSQIQKWSDVKCTLIYTVIRKGKVLYESQGRTGKKMAHAG